MSEFIKTQQEVRANLTEQIRDVIDSAEAEGRGLDAAELEKIDRIEADIRRADEAIDVAKRNEERKVEASAAAKGFVPAASPEVRSADSILRAIAAGEERGFEFDKRTLVPTTNTVPKSFYEEVFDVARLVGPMLDGGISEIINTTSGEDLTIPTLTAYSTAAITAAAGTIAASDPTYSSITLGAYKYGVLVQAASELVTDAGFNLASHLANQAGNAIGFAVNGALTNGTGTNQPTGIVTAASAGVTGSTAVGGAFTADNLIDLAYFSLDGLVRRLPGTGYMANGRSIGAMRKLKDDDGAYLYQVGVGQPDQFAGFPVVENPAMPNIGTSAKSVLFGHLPSYKVRLAGGLQVASSTDFAFNTDLVTWRFLIRVDGNLTHTGHVNYFQGGAS
jgi:HK97 family phage major capsid protein